MKKNDINIDTESEIFSLFSTSKPQSSPSNTLYEKSTFTSEMKLLEKLQKRTHFSQSTPFITKLKINLKNNLWFIFTILFTLIIYTGYIFIYLSTLLSLSHTDDYHFYLYLNDNLYRKAFIYFILLHSLMFMWIYSMIYSMLSDPGVVDDEYKKYFSIVLNASPISTSLPSQKFLLHQLKKLHCDNIDDNSNPLSNESFNDLFVNDIDIEHIEKENFFKFLYYTSNIDVSALKKSKRFCVFCKMLRPERCHHCIKCKRCVLRMDHHCNFLNICVGLKNYRPWMIFLFYSNSLFFFIFITMLEGVKIILKTETLSGITLTALLIILILSCIGWISVMELYVTHLYFISNGVTTKEDRTETRTQLIVQKGNSNFIDNFINVFGYNVIYWFWPKVRNFQPWEGYIGLKEESLREFIVRKRNEFVMEWNKEVNTGNKVIEERNEDSKEDNNTAMIEIDKSIGEPL